MLSLGSLILLGQFAEMLPCCISRASKHGHARTHEAEFHVYVALDSIGLSRRLEHEFTIYKELVDFPQSPSILLFLGRVLHLKTQDHEQSSNYHEQSSNEQLFS